ncbi:phytanoyl-CoA dioxygenase family protein, partial [Paenibacillus sp. TAF58]
DLHTWGELFGRAMHGADHMPQHKRLELLPEGVKIKPVPFEIKKGQGDYHHCMTLHDMAWLTAESIADETVCNCGPLIAVHYMPGHIRNGPIGNHPMNKHVRVQPGEFLTGEDFPDVYKK